MSLHSVPLCYRCENAVEGDRVFAAPCDHEDCASAVFHPICLMEWREHREARDQAFEAWAQHHKVVGFRVEVVTEERLE